MPKTTKAEIQAAANARGETLNEFIATAIDERLERIAAEKHNRPWYYTKEAEKAIKNLNSKIFPKS